MSCCDTLNGGSPAIPFVPPGALCGTPICIDVTTTDATVQTINLGDVASQRGSAVTFSLILCGIHGAASGANGLYFGSQGNAAQGVGGVGFVQALAVGPLGYVDPVLAAWTTPAIPAGWAAAVNFAGTVFRLQFNAAAGQIVHWRGIIQRWAHNGAVLS